METNLTSFSHVDAHCHLDLFPAVEPVITQIVTESICTVSVTNAPFLFRNTQTLAERSPLILPALGLHPELVASHGDQIRQFRELLPQTRYVGEIGLDYVTKDQDNRKAQERVFTSILGWCADATNKVLTIHSRRAAPDVIAAIGEHFPGTIILHWYSGSLRDLRRAIKSDFFFSVNSAMLRSESGRRLLQELPHDRVLTETDGPFIHEGGAPATPSCVTSTVDGLAKLWSKPPIDVQKLIQQNATYALLPGHESQQ